MNNNEVIMDDQIQKHLMAKQQKLIGELVERNMVLETYVELLQQQLRTLAEQDLENQQKPANDDVQSPVSP